MKKIIFLSFLLSIAFFSFARPAVNDKVLAAFQKAFPTVTNVQWYQLEDGYEAYFDQSDVKTRLNYDFDGNIRYVRRDYYGTLLSPFLIARMAELYPKRTVYGVTEVISGGGISYCISLQDEKTWIQVTCDGFGNVMQKKQYNKAEK